MKYYSLVKNLGKISLLALIPIILIIRFKWDAILPIIIYFQLLLIWAQAEIALRQHILFSAQYDPFFNIKISSQHISLHNTSKNPAYNIRIGRILDKQNKPIPHDSWKDKLSSELINSLGPDQEISLCHYKDIYFLSNKAIEVSYTNQIGDMKEIYIRGGLLIPGNLQKPGFFLNTLEDLTLFIKFIKFKRYLKFMKKLRLGVSKVIKEESKKD